MNQSILVRLKFLYPFDDGTWEESAVDAISQLQQDGVNVFFADDATTAVDILFVAYEARDQALAVEEQRLKLLVDDPSTEASRIVLLICSVSRPKVTDSQFRQLLITQVTTISQDRVQNRAPTLDDFRNMLRLHVNQYATKVKLMRGTTDEITSASSIPLRLSPGRQSSYGPWAL